MPLHQIAENLWEIPGEVKLGPGTYFPCRAMLVKRHNGALLLHSPVKMTTNDIAQIKDLGEVQDIVAPNTFHHLFMPKAIETFPNATIWGAKGLEKKRKDINFDHILGTHEPEWSEDFAPLLISGCPTFNEWVFFHTSSKTLVVTDLMFNIHETRGMVTKMMLKMAGVYQKTSQSKVWRIMLVKDKAACKASVEQMLQWPIKRTVMAHGLILENDAHTQTARALDWILQGSAMQVSHA